MPSSVPQIVGLWLPRMMSRCVGRKSKNSWCRKRAVRVSPPVRSLSLASSKRAPCVVSFMIAARTPRSRATSFGMPLYRRSMIRSGDTVTAYSPSRRIIVSQNTVLPLLPIIGNNGKTVFCETIMRLLGEYAVTVSPDLIMLRRYSGIPNDVARLRGVRAAIMNETTQGARFDEAKLKDLTGGDTLTARFLHQEFFDFRPTHRLIIRGNHNPTICGTDEGI